MVYFRSSLLYSPDPFDRAFFPVRSIPLCCRRSTAGRFGGCSCKLAAGGPTSISYIITKSYLSGAFLPAHLEPANVLLTRPAWRAVLDAAKSLAQVRVQSSWPKAKASNWLNDSTPPSIANLGLVSMLVRVFQLVYLVLTQNQSQVNLFLCYNQGSQFYRRLPSDSTSR